MVLYSLLRRTFGAAVVVLTLTSPAYARRLGPMDLGKDGKPQIKSASALVIDLTNDAVLYEKEADLVRPIASISKVFAALVFVEDCKLDPDGLHEMTVLNREAAKGGDKSKLTTGWSYSHRDLLHAALMRSDNRAMPALAEACGLDITTFAQKMTAKAHKLGLLKTNFKEPDGLSVENVSTAREVMVGLRDAIKLPVLTEIMGKQEYELVARKDGRLRPLKIRNTDRLLSKNLAVILGGKTGYTDIARYCLAIAAKTFSSREVGMVFLGAEGRYTRFADFARVVRWLTPDEKAAALVAAQVKAERALKIDERSAKAEDRAPAGVRGSLSPDGAKPTNAVEPSEQNADEEQDD